MTDQQKINDYKVGVKVKDGAREVEITGPLHNQHGALFAFCKDGTVLIRSPYDEYGRAYWAETVKE